MERSGRPSRVGVARTAGVALAALVVLSALAGTAGGAAPRAASADGRTVVLGAGLPLPTSRATGSGTPLAASTPVALTVALAPRHPAALAAEIRAIDGPLRAPALTAAQFRSEFSPTAGAVASVEAYLTGYGANDLSATPDGLGVSAILPAASVDAAFGVTLVGSAPVPGTTPGPLYTVVGSPSVPSSLGGIVAGVDGLSNVASAHYSSQMARLAPPARLPSTGVGQFVNDLTDGTSWYFGSDWAQAYGLPGLFSPSAAVPNGTFPLGSAVATLLMSAYNQSANIDLPPYDPAVVASYFNDTFPTSWPQPNVSGVPVTINGVTPPVPGYFGGYNDSTLDESENSLDLEMAGSFAPGARLVNFYFAGSLYANSSAAPALGSLADYFAQTLAVALNHNYSPARLTAVTCSFGLPDLNDTLWNTELLEAAATGVTVVAASGDQANAPNYLSGRFQGQWPTWPASVAFGSSGVISVGGLSVGLNGAPTSNWSAGQLLNATFDPSVRGIAQQSAWYDGAGGAGNLSGTEGGVSTVYAEPGWQFDSAAQPAIVNATLVQGASNLGRAAPDLALPANDTIAYVARDAAGTYFAPLEGTSIAAPLFAGLIASVAAVAHHPLGFLDPELYRIASYFAQYPGPSDPFLDVVTGGNFVFSAAPGWDPVTGWGSVNATRLYEADQNPAIAGYVYTGPTPGLPSPIFLTPPGPFDIGILALVGVSLAAAIVLVIVVARPRPGRPVPVPPAGAGVWASPPPGSGVLPPSAPSPYPPPPWAPGMGPPAPPPPTGGALPPWPPSPGPLPPPAMAVAFFHCPYCGTLRPAEPVRCPGCARY